MIEEREPTAEDHRAKERAIRYVTNSAFSFDGLIHQLEYNQYSYVDAVYVADNCGANWDEQVLKKAQSYLKKCFVYKKQINRTIGIQRIFSREDKLYCFKTRYLINI